MNDRERFLRAIEAEPDDDAVRLVFADWLDDNGDPDRARFIRLQCEHARLYPRSQLHPVESEARTRLEKEIEELLKRHRAAWTAGLPAWAAKEQFERGFLHVWFITGKQFIDAAGAIRAVAPLPSLHLRLLKGREEAVFASEHLGGLHDLWMDHAQVSDAGVAHLARSPHLGRLSTLRMARSTYDDQQDANKLTDAAAVALAGSDRLPSLTDLDLGGYKKITAAGVRALAESEGLAGLTSLDVSGGPGGPEVGEAFRSASFRLTRLQSLDLDDRKLGDAGAAALAASGGLSELRSLSAEKNGLSDAGVRAILASAHLRGVLELCLSDNPKVTDAAARAILADGRQWRRVTLESTKVSQALLDEIPARQSR
jgi:uncharacterized protein (TIGR02996 family)